MYLYKSNLIGDVPRPDLANNYTSNFIGDVPHPDLADYYKSNFYDRLYFFRLRLGSLIIRWRRILRRLARWDSAGGFQCLSSSKRHRAMMLHATGM